MPEGTNPIALLRMRRKSTNCNETTVFTQGEETAQNIGKELKPVEKTLKTGYRNHRKNRGL